MKVEEQIEKLVSYFKQGEEEVGRIGIEVEHLIISKEDLTAVNYDDSEGIEKILKSFSGGKIKQHKEENQLLSLSASQFDITVEPGGQLEVGIKPQNSIKKLKEIYDNFLSRLLPILEQYNYLLVTLGYQPQSKIKDISWLPKKRYKIMANYLEKEGQYAHNMMKGTAAFQLALDYKSESDFINKFRVAMVLSPVLSILFDNAPFFEGKIFENQALRTLIWNNTDENRTGIIKEVFSDDFGYRKYSQYILSREPILLKSNGNYFSTGQKTAAEIFKDQDLGLEELEHILTMVFPDVRAKQFIEIRMTDSIPPALFLAVVAFWKGIFYNDSILSKAVKFIEDLKVDDVLKAKGDIIEQGLKAQLGDYSILEVANKFLLWAKAGLEDDEQNYLKPLEQIIVEELTPAQKLKEQLKDSSKEKLLLDFSLNAK